MTTFDENGKYIPPAKKESKEMPPEAEREQKAETRGDQNDNAQKP